MINLSKGFKKYFYNTSWLMVEKVAKIGISALVGILVARYLQPTNYGLLSYAVSIVGLFGALTTLGLDNILIRDLVDKDKKRDSLLGTSLLLRLAGAFVLNIILLIIASFESRLTGILIITVGISTFFSSFKVIQNYFYARVEAKYPVLVQFSQTIISAILKIVFIAIGAPVIYFGVLIILDNIIIAIGLLYFYAKQKKSFFKWRAHLNTAKYLLHQSWPLILSSVMVSLYMRIDQVMVKNMLDATAVGHYAAAVKLSEAWYFIPMAIVNSLYPALIKAKSKSERMFRLRFKQLYSILFWIAITVSIVVTFLATPIILILYGSAYLPAASVLSIHIWASVFVFWGVTNTKWLLIENLQKYTTINTFIGATVNIVLNFILIPRMGIMGSALATIIAYGFGAMFLFLFNQKLRDHYYLMIKSITTIPSLKSLT